MRRLVNIMDATKQHATYEDITRYCRKIHSDICGMYHGTYIQGIVGITRGGLVPATILAHMFEVNAFGTVEAITYDNDQQQLPKNKIQIRMDNHTLGMLRKSRTLLVDDIFDTGRTMSLIEEFAPLCLKAAVFVKGNKSGLEGPPFFYGAVVPEPYWVVFPWEVL